MNIKNILIGVSGGIAAYKVPLFVRLLVKEGYNVKVVLTKSAEGLVGIDALRTLTGNPVYTERVGEYDMNHIRLEEWADLFIVAPATANTIAKITHGIADNLLSTLFLSIKAPILIAPAMNVNMWENRATQANIKTLIERDISVLPVGFGELACGVIGAGRMVEVEDLLSYVKLAPFSPTRLLNKKVLVVSGPTEEAIDPVRIITNRSSGKMGNAVVRASLAMGATTKMISGPALSPVPSGVEVCLVKSADEMFEQVKNDFSDFDVIIMVAAVSDYKIKNFSTEKIAREKTKELQLELIPNEDIAHYIGSNKKDGQLLITFSLESGGIDRAIEKMKKKGSDIAVYNKVENSLEKNSNAISIIYKDGREPQSVIGSKEECAKEILKSL